jgi:hypothetical protein
MLIEREIEEEEYMLVVGSNPSYRGEDAPSHDHMQSMYYKNWSSPPELT